MSDKLASALWVDLKKSPSSLEDRVVEALKRALDNTTPERPGVPWEGEEENSGRSGRRGYYIPGSDE